MVGVEKCCNLYNNNCAIRMEGSPPMSMCMSFINIEDIEIFLLDKKLFTKGKQHSIIL
jgi:hypothetical protein